MCSCDIFFAIWTYLIFRNSWEWVLQTTFGLLFLICWLKELRLRQSLEKNSKFPIFRPWLYCGPKDENTLETVRTCTFWLEGVVLVSKHQSTLTLNKLGLSCAKLRLNWASNLRLQQNLHFKVKKMSALWGCYKAS